MCVCIYKSLEINEATKGAGMEGENAAEPRTRLMMDVGPETPKVFHHLFFLAGWRKGGS
jgi:hypothetical protein